MFPKFSFLEDNLLKIYLKIFKVIYLEVLQGLNIYRPVTTNIINIINSTERLKGTLFTRGVTGV